jgi:maltose O-acetyltransferase
MLAKPVTIKENCWIEDNVVICPGVTIGRRSVVKAGSVVTVNVPSDSIVGGNPAQTQKIT